MSVDFCLDYINSLNFLKKIVSNVNNINNVFVIGTSVKH